MITVLRLGHRRGRDDRISSHVGLTARQFGAGKVIYSGEKDDNMLESLRDVRDRWGGELDISYREDYRRVIRDFEGTSVHLTMYGLPFQDEVDAVREAEDILIVVGSQKVPRDVYELVDHNLAVGHQPHSEVAAVGIFLYEFVGREVPGSFPGAHIEVEPSADQKLTREPE